MRVGRVTRRLYEEVTRKLLPRDLTNTRRPLEASASTRPQARYCCTPQHHAVNSYIYNWTETCPLILPLPVGHLDSHLTHGFLGPHEST